VPGDNIKTCYTVTVIIQYETGRPVIDVCEVTPRDYDIKEIK